MTRLTAFVIFLLGLTTLSTPSRITPSSPPTNLHAHSPLQQHPPTLQISEEESLVLQMKRVVQSLNKFSSRLFNVMNEYENDDESPAHPSHEDLAYSPVTIFNSLAALREGARRDTNTEMGNILALSKVNQSVLENGIGLLLESYQHPTEKGSLNLLTRIFLDHSFHPHDSYANKAKDKYASEIVQTHFSNATAATRFVNNHMYSASHGVLQDVLAEDDQELTTELPDSNSTNPTTHSSTSSTLDGGVMLVTGFTLEADWERSFTPLLTKRRRFTREDGSSTFLDTMHRDGPYYHAEIPELNASALSIPYKGHRFSFTIILPEPNVPLSQVEQNLESFPFPAVLSRLKKQHVQLALPRFQVDTTVDLIDPLEQLGITRVFAHQVADLSGLAKSAGAPKSGEPQELYLTNAVHKTFLDISEGGSRVPSANFIEAVPAMSRHLTPFSATRPFVFFISDHLIQTVVLVGRKAQ